MCGDVVSVLGWWCLCFFVDEDEGMLVVMVVGIVVGCGGVVYLVVVDDEFVKLFVGF